MSSAISLRAVAQRFLTVCRDNEYVARLGGDEFAVLQFPFKTSEDIDRLAEKLLNCFDEPFEVEGRKITISASIGSRAPNRQREFHRSAPARGRRALPRQKCGRATYCPFNEEMGRQLLVRGEIESDLREASRTTSLCRISSQSSILPPEGSSRSKLWLAGFCPRAASPA